MAALVETAANLLRDARQARLQRSLSLLAGLTSGLSGLEVAYMHYRGSYGNRIMWTPILMSQALLGAGVAAAIRPRLARTLLPAVAAVTLADCATGFVFHLRGVHRKPGGWKLLRVNVPMGPPPFAPLLFGMSAYMGMLAARLPTEGSGQPAPGEAAIKRHLRLITAVSALCSGTEALYSHYKNNFRYRVQWTPIALAPLLAAAALLDRPRWLLPAASVAAMVDGAVGSGFHTRGVVRRSGGAKHLMYNIMYGPPLLAPLLFAACGLFGLLASVMRGNKA
ncbi:MAG: hypothetical protein ACRD01_09155 [Terriglobales bacterium]